MDKMYKIRVQLNIVSDESNSIEEIINGLCYDISTEIMDAYVDSVEVEDYEVEDLEDE